MAALEIAEASWWTASGWSYSRQPDAYIALMAQSQGDEPHIGWDEGLKLVGYVHKYSSDTAGLGISSFEVTVWENHGKSPGQHHLYVDLSDARGGLAEFFVAKTDIAAFWFDKLPILARQQREMDEPSLVKAFVAFVRHGHGEHVIDEYGDLTLEEQRRNREDWRQRERDRKAESAAKTKAAVP